MEFKDLKGKVVVITGASTGIGRASAVEFAKHGAKLVICGRNSERLQETKQLCIAQGISEKEVSIALGDLVKDETLNLIVKTAVDTFGKVDVLHLNAGKVHPINGPVTSPESIESLDFYYELYIKCRYKLTQKMSAELIKSKGSIVMTSGIMGSSDFTNPHFSGVGIIEAGHQQMGRLFALTLANKGVRFNTVEPGFVRTPILDVLENIDEKLAVYEDTTPLGSKLCTPEEIACVVVFLASDQSACMTGCKLTTDRGCTLSHPAVDWKQF